MRLVALEADEQAFDLARVLICVTGGPARAVGEGLEAVLLKASKIALKARSRASPGYPLSPAGAKVVPVVTEEAVVVLQANVPPAPLVANLTRDRGPTTRESDLC